MGDKKIRFLKGSLLRRQAEQKCLSSQKSFFALKSTAFSDFSVGETGESIDRLPDRIILEAKVVRSVTGLGILEHGAVTIVSLAGNHCHTVVIVGVEMKVFFVNLGYFFPQ